jgi:hypothetical protein
MMVGESNVEQEIATLVTRTPIKSSTTLLPPGKNRSTVHKSSFALK